MDRTQARRLFELSRCPSVRTTIINEVDAILRIHQDVFQLDVVMDITTLVNVIQCGDQLRKDVLDLRKGQAAWVSIEQVQQALGMIVHVDPKVVGNALEFPEFDNIGMALQLLKDAKLVLRCWCLGKGFDSDFGVLIEEDGDNVSGSGHLFGKIILPTWY